MIAGKQRRFEDVEFEAIRTRWYLKLEERHRLHLLTIEALLQQEEPWTLNELRFFVAFLRLNPEDIGAVLGFSPEGWDAVRNNPPLADYCNTLRPFFREHFERVKDEAKSGT